MGTITVKDAAGDNVEVELPSAAGRAPAAASRPVALSDEDKAALDALATSLETIELGPTSLTALESVTVGGTVELGAASLAALETINVGTVDLGAASLGALETITVGGTVDLGAASLAALESITAAGPLTDQQLRQSAVPVALAASENVVGAAAGLADLVEVTLSLDTTGSYAAGDVLAETQVLTDAMRIVGGRGVLQSVVVVDEDDQGQALDLVFLSATQSLGAENAVVSISDAGARSILGIVPIAAADFVDLGGVRVASIKNVGVLLEAAAGSRDLFVAAISRGTGTYTASGLRLRLGLVLS